MEKKKVAKSKKMFSWMNPVLEVRSLGGLSLANTNKRKEPNNN